MSGPFFCEHEFPDNGLECEAGATRRLVFDDSIHRDAYLCSRHANLWFAWYRPKVVAVESLNYPGKAVEIRQGVDA